MKITSLIFSLTLCVSAAFADTINVVTISDSGTPLDRSTVFDGFIITASYVDDEPSTAEKAFYRVDLELAPQ